MIFEIIIFIAIAGIIVIVGRKLPAIMNSGENRFVGEREAAALQIPKFDRIQPKASVPIQKEVIIEKEELIIETGSKEQMPSEDNGQLDELLQSIDFINETNGDDFWEEPTFFSEDEVERINQEKVKKLKFNTKVKDVGDYEHTGKSAKIDKKEEPKEVAKDSKTEEKHEDNIIPKKVLPKTPIGVGLSTNLTIRDLLVQANKSFLAKNYLKAEEFYIKAASHDPNNPRIYSRLGIIYLKQGKYGDARESLTYSISLDDSSSTQYFNLAVACLHLNDQNDAVNHIKKAISIEPTNQKYQEILSQIG